ncbi:putative retrotransposon hot spot (RHS) protein [Trypanosoma cruzi]|nr:putative retrotransposon hot spot (RHS) protein [Trypanosoma cruzi]
MHAVGCDCCGVPHPFGVSGMAGNFVPRHGWMRIASACVSLGDCLLGVRSVLAAGCGRVPLAVGLNWRRWRCVRLLCGGPNPLTRGLTALRWCLCVCEGWCGRCSSVLFLPDCLVSRPLRGCSGLVSTNVSDVLPLLLSPPPLESTR